MRKERKTHTIVEGEQFSLLVYFATHISAFTRTKQKPESSAVQFTLYLVIIEFNDLANEQNSDSRHNSEQRRIFFKFYASLTNEREGKENCSIILGSIAN